MIVKNITERRLVVMDSEVQDNDRHVTRVDPDTMNDMGLMDGDEVEVTGEANSKILTCLSLLPTDTGRGIIRLDIDSRNEVGVMIGDMILLRHPKTPKYSNRRESDAKESYESGTE